MDRHQGSSAQLEVPPPPPAPPLPLQQHQQPVMPMPRSTAAILYDSVSAMLEQEPHPGLMSIANTIDNSLVVYCSAQEDPAVDAGAGLVLRYLEDVRQEQLMTFMQSMLGGTNARQEADSAFPVVLVRHIDLSDLKVGAEVFNYLLRAAERLETYFPLWSLELAGCGLGNAEFCALAEAKPLLGKLRRLDLGDNDLGFSGLEQVCTFPRLILRAPLEYLALDHTGFSEKALVYALTFLCQSYLDTQPTERNTINSLQALRLGPTVDGETLSLLAVGLIKQVVQRAFQLHALVVHGLCGEGSVQLEAEWIVRRGMRMDNTPAFPTRGPWRGGWRMSTLPLEHLVPAEEAPSQHKLPAPTQEAQPGPRQRMPPSHAQQAQLPAVQHVEPPSNSPVPPPYAQHAQPLPAQHALPPPSQHAQPPPIQPALPQPAQIVQQAQPTQCALAPSAQQSQPPPTQHVIPLPSQQHVEGAGAPPPQQQQQQQQGMWGGTQGVGRGGDSPGGGITVGGTQPPTASQEAQRSRQGLVADAGAGGSARGMAGSGEQSSSEHSPDKLMAGGILGTQPTPSTRQTPGPYTPYPHQGEAPATVQGGGGGSLGTDERQTISPLRPPPTKRSRATQHDRGSASGSGQDPGATPSEAAARLQQLGVVQQEQEAGPSSSRALQFGRAASPAGAAVEQGSGSIAAASHQPAAADDTCALCSDEDEAILVEMAKNSDGSW